MTTSFTIKSTRPNHQAIRIERVNADGVVTPLVVLGDGERYTGYAAGETFRISEAPREEISSTSIERTFSIAERMAGVPFNPGNRADVANCKEEFAACIARMLTLRDSAHDSEVKRMASIAITELQTAQMWAVKALTWQG